MSDLPRAMRARKRIALWLLVSLGLLLLALANTHLVYVAASSQPACVAHLRPGEGHAGQFSAAASSCSPR